MGLVEKVVYQAAHNHSDHCKKKTHPNFGSRNLNHTIGYLEALEESCEIETSQLRHLDGIVTLVDAKHLIMHLDEADQWPDTSGKLMGLTLMEFAYTNMAVSLTKKGLNQSTCFQHGRSFKSIFL